MSFLTDYKPEFLTLGAGGMKGFSELGALWWFYTNGNLEKIRAYSGSSIGAIICVLLLLGYTPYDIMLYALETKLFDDIAQIQFTEIIHEYGLLSNRTYTDAIAIRLQEMIVKKIGKVPNLKELYEITGKRCVIVISSLKDEEEIAADHITQPTLDLIKALRSSANVPILFGKLEHQHDYWSDGALLNPFPINYLDDGVTPMLAIGVFDKIPWSFNKIKIMEYYNRIANLPLKRLTEYSIANASNSVLIVLIPVENDVGLLNIKNETDQRLEIFMTGYWYTDEFVRREEVKRVWNKEPEITEKMIERCFESQTVKLLLRSMRENPEMLSKIMSEKGVEFNFGVTVSPKTEEVKQETQKSYFEEPKQFWNRPKPVPKQEESVQNPNDEEDIIEIPPVQNNFQTEFPEPFFDVNYGNNMPYFTTQQYQSQNGYVFSLNLNIANNLLDGIFEMMMGEIRNNLIQDHSTQNRRIKKLNKKKTQIVKNRK